MPVSRKSRKPTKNQSIHALTGSDALILTKATSFKNCEIPNPAGHEFRLTLTIYWEEYRQAGQPPGRLTLEYRLAKTTPALPGIGVEAPVLPVAGVPQTFDVVTIGLTGLRYYGEANAHIWFSYFAEFSN